MKDRIVIVAGDPNSINSEIIFKSFKKIKNNLKKFNFESIFQINLCLT